MTDLNELKRLAEAATPGPWSCPIEDHDSIAAQVEFIERPGGLALSAVWLASVDQENRGDYDSERCFSQEAENDRRFIAAANPQTVLDLIARLETLERWKAEAIAVESKWDVQAVGRALHLPLGSSIRAAIQPGVEALTARLERAEKALEQAVDAGSLAVATVVKDAGYGMWRYEGVECIVGQSATENFFAGHPEDSPELAAWLKERR